MAPFRRPLFSQAPTWLPPWLIFSPLGSDLLAYDTPSMFATSCEDVQDLSSLHWESKSSSPPVSREEDSRADHLLCFSEDVLTNSLAYESMKDFSLKSRHALPSSIYLQPKTLVLQLSLSPREITVASNYREGGLENERCKKIIATEAPSLEFTTQQPTNCVTGWDPSCQGIFQTATCAGVTEAHNAHGTINQCKAIFLPLSQRTSPTDLYVPPVQMKQCQGNVEIKNSGNNNLQSLYKRPAENHISAMRSGKKVKLSSSKIIAEDVEAAIGLTVATAETLVIADVMKATCRDCGPRAILDAAFEIKRGREQCGLDAFTLETGAYEDACDENWTEGLNDFALEEEFLNVGVLEVRKESHHDATCVDSHIYASNISGRNQKQYAVPGTDDKAGALTIVNHQASGSLQLLDGAADVREIFSTSMFNSERCNPALTYCNHPERQMLPKESFSSRWLGGWTGGINKDVEQQIQPNVLLVGKSDKFVEFETSDLSEPCNWSPVECLGKNVHQPQQNGYVALITSTTKRLQRRNDHTQTLSAESCAEILMTMSQASVKCSLSAVQEPLCSFVPCSIAANVTTPSAKLAGSGDHVAEALKAGGNSGKVVTGVKTPEKNFQAVNTEKENIIQAPFQSGVKRRQLSSLKAFSTSPLLCVQENATLMTETKHCLQNVPEGNCGAKNGKIDETYLGKQSCTMETNELVRDTTLKFADITQLDSTAQEDATNACIKKSSSNGQSKRLSQDSDLRNSPPLTWYRGKKRRLRASRIVESALIQDSGVDVVSQLLSVHCPVNSTDGMPLAILNKDKPHAPCSDSKEVNRALKYGNSTLFCGNGSVDNLVASRSLEMLKVRNWESRSSKDLQTSKGDQVKWKGGSGANCQSDLFRGLEFLLTGFPAKKKTMCEEVKRKVQQHSGVLLSNVPVFSALHHRKPQQQQEHLATCPIIVSPRQVRTMKFLYGCAVGSLIVKPSWIDDCITARTVLSMKMNGEKGTKYHHSFLRYKKEGSELFLFNGIGIFLHGEWEYCSKLSFLIKHGGGQLLRSLKHSMQRSNVKGPSTWVVVVEHQSGIPQSLKHTAGSLGFPIVSGDWIISSLLEGRLLPLPAVVSSIRSLLRADPKAPIPNSVDTRRNLTQRKAILSKRRHGVQSSSCIDGSCNAKKKSTSDICITFLGEGKETPAFSRPGLYFDFLMKYSKAECSIKLSENNLYFTAIRLDGIIYSTGDVIEIHPYTKDEKEPYVAQIQNFYCDRCSTMRIRSSTKTSGRELQQECFMCCRWFYRPSDTGFPCVGTDKDLYLSHHFDANAPVQSIIKKVIVVLFVDGKIFTNHDDVGWKTPEEGSCIVESADYVCRFFYDYKKESLHQVKSGFTS